ncbi:iroquois-class homeodomain protein IRX-3 [Microcaecilia unicolor]|uniref:Iroquois-class homeodomain protein IRX-3 n=1 Tax=Microcaecilia unicolor TaxID=1415580 RepID=A0A6P7YBG7_9AMPH|nr:iroquois-class homeodomain protein IRX-3 [Microcaecilia unicolor]
MSFPQLGYQYIRPIYPSDRQGLAGSRNGTELTPAGTLSNVLSSMYGSPYAAAQGYGAFLPYTAELPIFPQLGAQYELKDSPGVQHAAFSHPHPAFYPYGQYQFGDPSRPKNATRESTSTLKAWLNEHRKNPYPTKGEKIMLAIITKMTLTQVSTWFANARRRLKKENKMTWAPRSRTDEEGNAYESDHEGGEKREDDEEIDLENIDTENIENKEDLDDQDQDLHSDSKTDARSDSEISDGYDDLNGSEERFFKSMVNESRVLDGDKCELPPEIKIVPPSSEHTKMNSISPSSPPATENNLATAQKPKIWSLAETATTPDNPRKSPQTSGSAAGTATQTLLPHHRLISCPASKFQNWTNRAFSAHQLSLLNSSHFLQGLNATQTPSSAGIAAFARQAEQVQSTESTVTDRSSALEVEKKLLKTAFQPVQRRPQNQLDAAMVLSALSSS